MIPEEKDMKFLKEELDKELKSLQLDGNAKRQILQKMKSSEGVSRRFIGWVAAVLSMAVMMMYGISRLSHEDLTDAPKMLAQPQITERIHVEPENVYHAVVYSCTVEENGTIWLKYDVNREKQKSASVNEDGTPLAYGIDEMDAAELLEAKYDGKWQWVPFNREVQYYAATNIKKSEEKNMGKVVYISSFSLVDAEDKLLAAWRNDGHSLFGNGMVLSSFITDDAGAGIIEEYIAAGKKNLRLVMENVYPGSTLYTAASGTVAEENGVIQVNISIE